MNIIRYKSEVLFENFKHLNIHIDPEQQAVWLYLDAKPRPCFTETLLIELKQFQSILKQNDGKLFCKGKDVKIEYSIFTSSHPVFNFGGDLELFFECIENNDRETLTNYARLCIDGLYANHIGRDLDLTTISLVHGNALGGGFGMCIIRSCFNR